MERGKLVTELDIPYAGCKPQSLSGLLALLMTWALPRWTEQQREEVNLQSRFKVSLRESLLVTEEDIAAADDIFDADEAEAAMEEAVIRRVAKTKSEAREAKRKSTTVVKASAPPKTVLHKTATTESSGPSASSSSSAAANAPSTSTGVVRLDKACVHFAGSRRFDSRGQRLLAVHCFFGICIGENFLGLAE